MSDHVHECNEYGTSYFRKHASAARNSASRIVPFVASKFRISSIADVGCGSGQWTREFISCGVETALSFDAYSEPIWGRYSEYVRFGKIDLEKEAIEIPHVDLVCWLEVAEHLSEAACENVLRSITCCTDVILFSCAVPGQGGTGHIRERWLRAWVVDFTSLGFLCADVIRPMFWNDENVSWWYRQNTVLFVREGSESSKIVSTSNLPSFGAMDLVHPDLFSTKCLLQKSDSDLN